MANKLNNAGYGQGVTVAQVLAQKGRNFNSGFMDEFDREAERAASAIGRARSLAPRKLGRKASGFGRAPFHPNADRHNVAMIG